MKKIRRGEEKAKVKVRGVVNSVSDKNLKNNCETSSSFPTPMVESPHTTKRQDSKQDEGMRVKRIIFASLKQYHILHIFPSILVMSLNPSTSIRFKSFLIPSLWQHIQSSINGTNRLDSLNKSVSPRHARNIPSR